MMITDAEQLTRRLTLNKSLKPSLCSGDLVMRLVQEVSGWMCQIIM